MLMFTLSVFSLIDDDDDDDDDVWCKNESRFRNLMMTMMMSGVKMKVVLRTRESFLYAF